MNQFRLFFVIFSDGERVPVLTDQAGNPHWSATLFSVTQIRNAGKAPNTTFAALGAVRSLLAWADKRGVQLEERFARREYLTEAEIESLANHARSSFRSPEGGGKVVISLPRLRRVEGARAQIEASDRGVSAGTQHARLSYIAKYLTWLATRFIEKTAKKVSDSSRAEIKEMALALKLKRPKKGPRSRLSSRSGLSEVARERLLQIAEIGAEDNPFGSAVQHRNEVIVRILDETGIRAGELLALKVTDFDFQKNEVVIARRHGDPDDPRVKQPVAKTLDRRIPLSSELGKMASNYVLTDRRSAFPARRHRFLFVVHKEGKHFGHPLSAKGLSKVLSTLKQRDPKRLAGLCCHIMRHTNNDRFSELMDTTNATAAEEEQMRSYLMGWKEGSGTSATYTRRHIQRKAREAFLKLQQRKRKDMT